MYQLKLNELIKINGAKNYDLIKNDTRITITLFKREEEKPKPRVAIVAIRGL